MLPFVPPLFLGYFPFTHVSLDIDTSPNVTPLPSPLLLQEKTFEEHVGIEQMLLEPRKIEDLETDRGENSKAKVRQN